MRSVKKIIRKMKSITNIIVIFLVIMFIAIIFILKVDKNAFLGNTDELKYNKAYTAIKGGVEDIFLQCDGTDYQDRYVEVAKGEINKELALLDNDQLKKIYPKQVSKLENETLEFLLCFEKYLNNKDKAYFEEMRKHMTIIENDLKLNEDK